MCNMHFFAVCSLFLATVTIGSSTPFIFDGLFQPNSGCTVLVTVPLNSYPPYGSYFEPELFPDMNTKLAANQDRYNRNLRQVWVDSPNPQMCGYVSNGRCCLNGFFEPNYEWLIFQTGDKKKLANEQLYEEAVRRNLNWYKVYADAPDRYCRKSGFGGLADFFG